MSFYTGGEPTFKSIYAVVSVSFRGVSVCYYILISKLVPQPQLLVASGLSMILNCEPINSIVKSTLLPLRRSRDGSSSIIFGPSSEAVAGSASSGMYWKIVSSSLTMEDHSAASLAGKVTRLMRYWNPWHPPLST